MKKIYLKNEYNLNEESRIIDADNLSFTFNRTDGSIYASNSPAAKTSEVKLIRHLNWRNLPSVDKLNFEKMAMEKLSNALNELYRSHFNILEIEVKGSYGTSCIYTFRIKHYCSCTDDYSDTLEITL